MEPAIIGLIGVLLGASISTGITYLIAARKEAADQKRRRGEKFEELVAALYEHKHWLDTIEQIWVYGAKEQIPVSPFAKVQAISSVYFPRFRPQVSKLELAAGQYEQWMFSAAQIRVKQGMPSIDGIGEIYGPYLSCFRGLMDDLVAFAEREF
jgi:hypothetical protein